MMNEPKPPAIPSIRPDGTVDANGLDLGCLNGWKSSENPFDTTVGTNPTDGVGDRLGKEYDHREN